MFLSNFYFLFSNVKLENTQYHHQQCVYAMEMRFSLNTMQRSACIAINAFFGVSLSGEVILVMITLRYNLWWQRESIFFSNVRTVFHYFNFLVSRLEVMMILQYDQWLEEMRWVALGDHCDHLRQCDRNRQLRNNLLWNNVLLLCYICGIFSYNKYM